MERYKTRRPAVPTTDTKPSTPAPSPWLTLALAVLIQVVGLAFYFGKNDNRLDELEKYKTDQEAKEAAAVAAMKQRFQEAEAVRNSEKDKEVAELAQAAADLRLELEKLRRPQQT